MDNKISSKSIQDKLPELPEDYRIFKNREERNNYFSQKLSQTEMDSINLEYNEKKGSF